MKIAIAGIGSIGERHLSNLIALNREGALDVPIESVTAIDADPQKRNKIETTFNIKTKPSLELALKQKQDVVFVCTPSNSHIALAQEAASAGCHLFIEKPVSNQLDGVETLKKRLEDSGKTCLVACNMWFHPGIQKFKEIVDSNELGELRLFRSYWGHHFEQWHPDSDVRNHYSLKEDQGGGSLFDVGSHELFFLPKLLGKINYASMDCGPSGFIDTTVDDFSHILVGLDNGVRGTFCFNFLDRCRRRSLELIGSKGTAIWRSEGKNPARESFHVLGGNQLHYEIPLDATHTDMYRATLIHFFACVTGKEKPLQSFEDAGAVLNIILSLKKHKQYRLGMRIK